MRPALIALCCAVLTPARRGPWLVVARDRGQTLRFYKGNAVRLNSTIIRNFLKDELWQHQEPWSSAFAPGGSRCAPPPALVLIITDESNRELLMHYFALGQRTVYDYMVRVPKFLLMIITGALGSVVMRLMHRAPAEKPKPAVKPQPAVAPAAPAPATTATPAGSPAKKTPSKKKGGKK